MQPRLNPVKIMTTAFNRLLMFTPVPQAIFYILQLGMFTNKVVSFHAELRL